MACSRWRSGTVGRRRCCSHAIASASVRSTTPGASSSPRRSRRSWPTSGSSAVVGLLRRHATGPVHTFSLAYEEGGDFDELAEARRSAASLGVEHHELRAGHADLPQRLRALVYHYDEPLGIAAGFNFFVL